LDSCNATRSLPVGTRSARAAALATGGSGLRLNPTPPSQLVPKLLQPPANAATPNSTVAMRTAAEHLMPVSPTIRP